MRVLVEILHPAHVHFFKNAISHWQARGDEVLVLSREKDVANALLDATGIAYRSISQLGKKKFSLVGEMLVRDVRMWSAARSFRPDVLVGIMGVTIVQVGKLIGKPAIVFYDTENATITNRFVYPLAHSVCTPECYAAPVNGRHVTYPSYHELAYLHPRRFTPDPEIVRQGGIDPHQPYFILRFVSWQASHDVGERGFDLSSKLRLVALLERHGRVLISSEHALPKELERYRFSAPVQHIHHFIAHARMLMGESATMASEAAVLGVPAFYIADTGRGYTDELESKYGLVFNFKLDAFERAITRVEELLGDPHLSATFAARRQKMLSERTDATSWVVDYVDQVAKERKTGFSPPIF
ncbi:MAG TPA: DUF354 domain-containing protein [Polyangiaceae bacterium]|nr:DUF354 domain-containing protein [Polyangiaceae bacterium]